MFDGLTHRLRDPVRLLVPRPGEHHHVLVAAVTGSDGLPGEDPPQQNTDLVQDAAADQVTVDVVDVLEVVQVEEDQPALAAAFERPLDLRGQAVVQVAIVVEAGEVVELRHLACALGVGRVGDRGGDRLGEDLEQVELAQVVAPRLVVVDQLEGADHPALEHQGRADHRLRAHPGGLAEDLHEQRVVADVRADVSAAGAVDRADDSPLGRDPQPDEAVGKVAEARDQGQLGGPLPFLDDRVVEENRTRLGGDEVVRPAQDVAEDRAQIEVI